MRLAIIGFGAIGQAVAARLADTGATLVGIVERAELLDEVREKAGAVDVANSIDTILRLQPDIVLECAGHHALRTFGGRVLESGKDLIVASVGALADPALETTLTEATAGGGRIIIPSGALGGLDAIGAAKRAGLSEVLYTSRKAPAAWRGTKAESMIDLTSVREPAVFFECNAREAALTFPQNANVVAALALAGIGFERTRVKLMVDPAASGNRHIVMAKGAFGEISSDVLARTLPENPKTSMLAPYSLLHTIAKCAGKIVV